MISSCLGVQLGSVADVVDFSLHGANERYKISPQFPFFAT
jgi:hypothetical protein